MFTIQFVRGTTAQNDAFTGAAGSLSLDTELNQLRIHDGVTVGGHIVSDRDQLQSLQEQLDSLGMGDIEGLLSALEGKLDASQKGAANGVATLGEDGRVPAAQLPSYVDDVIEAADFASLPAEGEQGKIYVTLDENNVYRWGGTAYVEIAASPGSTDGVAEGTTNLFFTEERARAAVSATGDLSYDPATGVFSFTAPEVTKEGLGLDQVQNFGIADEPTAVAAESNEAYMTPLRTRNFVESIGFQQDAEGNWSLDAGTLS